MSSQGPTENPQKKGGFLEKFKASLNQFRSNEKVENLVSYATANTRDTISYIILIVGVVMLFFNSLYGGTLIGLVAGFYFSSELLAFVQNINDLVEDQGIVKSLVGGGLLLGLFISAPAIFIGLALAVAIRQILFPEARK